VSVLLHLKSRSQTIIQGSMLMKRFHGFFRELAQKLLDKKLVQALKNICGIFLRNQRTVDFYPKTSAFHTDSKIKLQEQFIYALAHDLRTPLTAAKTNTLLITRLPHQPDIVPKLCSRIIRDLDRINQMIEDLLNFSHIGAGQMLTLKIEPANLRLIIFEIIEEFSAVYGNRFVLKSPGIEGYWCRKSLRRALENLLNNAIKYGYPTSCISILVDEHGEDIEIAVHNEGDHIPLEQQATLFTPHCRAKSAEDSGKIGWGIGLALVRGVAEAHGGHVRVQSSPSVGTTFTMSLPKGRAITP
jgi:signal transduction histidine kinase